MGAREWEYKSWEGGWMQRGGKYWFPAKRYGWGWGFPCAWQGWLVFAAFLALIVAGIFAFPPARSLSGFIIYTAIVSALLVAVCWLKGEPPRWRWGGD